jgi:hypothetical protein
VSEWWKRREQEALEKGQGAVPCKALRPHIATNKSNKIVQNRPESANQAS